MPISAPPTMARSRPDAASIRRATSSSPGTARPAAFACPNADWIAADRTGPSICDATSAAFAQDIDWAKIDVGTFSWQKALGGEAAHGMLVLSPRAVERLESEPAPRPLPKIFRLTKGGKLIDGIFKGETINTPSMLCVEDWLFALDWAERIGGLDALIARADANAAALDRWVQRRDWIEHLGADPAIRSNTSVCLQFADRSDEDANRARQKAIGQLLEREDAAYDVAAYRDAPPGFASGAGRRSTPPTSKRSGRGSTGLGRRRDERAVKVLIADKMDPRAAAIFRERGIDGRREARPLARRAERDHRRL